MRATDTSFSPRRTVVVDRPKASPVEVKPQENEAGEFIGHVLGGLAHTAIALKALLPQSSTSSTDSAMRAQSATVFSGPMYGLLKEMTKFPLSEYDTPAIIRERQRQIEVPHDLAVNGGVSNTLTIDTPERKKLRDEIVDKLYGAGAEKKEGQAWILVAVPAAGKSTMSESLARDNGALDIDSDGALDYLPEWQQNHVSCQVGAERNAIEQRVQDRAIANHDNVILNIVPRTDHVQLEAALRQLKGNGYTTHLVLLDLPAQKAIERALARFERIGRYNDPFVEGLMHDGPSKAYEALKHSPLVDTYAKYSTDVDYNAPAKELEVGDNRVAA